jgi:hypothetical protein
MKNPKINEERIFQYENKYFDKIGSLYAPRVENEGASFALSSKGSTKIAEFKLAKLKGIYSISLLSCFSRFSSTKGNFCGKCFFLFTRARKIQTTIARCTTREKVKSLTANVNSSLITWKIFLITVKMKTLFFHPDSRQCFLLCARKKQINLDSFVLLVAFCGVGRDWNFGKAIRAGVNSSIPTIHYAIEPNTQSASYPLHYSSTTAMFSLILIFLNNQFHVQFIIVVSIFLCFIRSLYRFHLVWGGKNMARNHYTNNKAINIKAHKT